MKRIYSPVDVVGRIATAVAGGYGMTILTARAAAATLPLEGGEAAIAASLGAWLAFIATVIWSFAAKSLVRAAVPPVVIATLLHAVAR